MAVATVDPTAVFVCCVAHMSGDPPAASQEGEEMRGSDPRVARAPHYFALKSSPKSEWPSPFDAVVERIDANSRSVEEERRQAFERRAKANEIKFAAPQLVKAKKDVVGELDGQPATVKRGSVLPADHPFVLEHQDAFS